MFLFRLLELLALIGLFVQAFLAWMFVALLYAIRGQERGEALRVFLRAFVALAVALSIMSLRFFRVHDVQQDHAFWADGSPFVVVCYSVYTALKIVFGMLLVRGSYLLAGRTAPPRLLAVGGVLVAAGATLPVFVHAVTHLLIAQAPVMVACSLVALRALRGSGSGVGVRIVRVALVGLAATWCVHALAAFGREWPGMHEILSFNSFLDLGVQLGLGVGLVVGLLQDTHRRLIEVEKERERLGREIARGERLRALGTVVSGVAHELNNPLTVILAYAEELREHEAGRREATIVAEQAERCRGIVRNLSALAGQSVHPREELELEALVRRVVRGLGAAPGRRDGRRVRVEPMAGLTLSADRIGLEQVLANLIANGLDAGAPDGLVTVGASASDGLVELRVRDTGPGVPAELRERVFEPFFTTKGPGEGTGLGLSIAHGIVRGHGGTLSIDDGPDAAGGATFVVTLPRERVPRRARRPASPAAAFLAVRGPGAGERLLVVDDEEALRAIVRRQAERRGWSVVEAASAEEALAVGLAGFAAVLCDLRMPGIGGIGLHDRLRAEEPELLERFVFVTGELASPDADAFAERCARPLVHKPFVEAELFERLEETARAARVAAPELP